MWSGLRRGFPLGALLVLSMVLANSTVEGRWDSNYITMFLLLKDIGRWPFRILTGLGYILFVLGMVSIIALAIKRVLNKKQGK